jgi:bifunctional ADP-heptose synthase (sugar kinase/adenylyltransferase)
MYAKTLIQGRRKGKTVSLFKVCRLYSRARRQTLKEILSELQPDTLEKGSGYKLSEIVRKEYVKKVCRVPFVKRKSTTNLITLNNKLPWL